ncbi:MAG: hypothetical protein FJ399_05670 [Verrucomicrobia bacterium]|nr:hypothetical protein [Verrucomicrobiota bacterium]
MNKPSLSLAFAAAVFLSPGCRKDEITTYRVPKEAAPPPTATATAGKAPATDAETVPPGHPPIPAGNTPDMADTAVVTATGAALTWTAPAQWTAKSASSMRKGSYAIKGEGGEADMAITAFPGDVGGDLANLNRWRGQLQLAPVNQGEFEAVVQRLERNGLKLIVVDIAGTGATPQRILGAMVPFSGATWFFKLTGPAALVASEKPAFLAMLDTVKPAAPAP